MEAGAVLGALFSETNLLECLFPDLVWYKTRYGSLTISGVFQIPVRISGGITRGWVAILLSQLAGCSLLRGRRKCTVSKASESSERFQYPPLRNRTHCKGYAM